MKVVTHIDKPKIIGTKDEQLRVHKISVEKFTKTPRVHFNKLVVRI